MGSRRRTDRRRPADGRNGEGWNRVRSRRKPGAGRGGRCGANAGRAGGVLAACRTPVVGRTIRRTCKCRRPLGGSRATCATKCGTRRAGRRATRLAGGSGGAAPRAPRRRRPRRRRGAIVPAQRDRRARPLGSRTGRAGNGCRASVNAWEMAGRNREGSQADRGSVKNGSTDVQRRGDARLSQSADPGTSAKRPPDRDETGQVAIPSPF